MSNSDNKIQLKDKNGKVLAEEEFQSLYSLMSEQMILGFEHGLVLAQKSVSNKIKSVTGWVAKSKLDTMNVSQVMIPANFAGLEAVAVPTRLEDQLFDIIEVVENEDYVEVTAQHMFYRQYKDYTLWKPDKNTNYSCAAVCRNVMSNTVSGIGFHVATDCTDTKAGSEFDYERKSIVEAFLDPENGICKKFGLSLIRDNDSFYVLKDVGFNRGIVIQDGKNLLGVERVESTDNVVTRVAPYGKNSKGNIIWLNNNGLKYIDSTHIDDYPVPFLELYDTGLQIGKDGVTAQNINGKLMEAGQKRFEEDKVDLPEVTMRIEFLSLGDTEEYAQYRGLDKVYLYDILTIKDTIRGYNYSAQVIGVEHDILTGMLNSVTIGSITEADASRKIAVWQVPEIDGTNIRLASIMAGTFAPGAINSDDIAENAVHWLHIDAASIDELTTQQLEALQANIHELIAGTITAQDITAGSITTDSLQAGAVTSEILSSGAVITDKLAAGAVTADKIGAGAVTTAKLDAYAVTAEKLAASAVTADKLAAGSVNADKIDANSVAAINAKLGTADIADARIAVADINFAQVKDLDAQSAFFGQAIIQTGVANKLFIPRLSVDYAQIVSATVGDLVIQATNDNYYKLDVDMDGKVTATQVTPSAAEIAAGHTSDGRTIYTATELTASELNTTDIYASHALIDKITANQINVDELWARDAFIGKLMVTDISSNTYIQSVIGDWSSGSTITQTISGINSRINQLGYGTIYYSETEPSHAGLVAGDIWIQPIDDNTWDDIGNYTWDQVGNWTWDYVMGQYRMYAWTGQRWRQVFDNLFITDLQTQIDQNAYAITLKANQSAVDTLSGQVTEFAATLEVQSQAITAAVATVNLKATNFVQYNDPTEDYEVHMGDTWTKASIGGTWDQVAGHTWDEIAEFTWDDLGGAKTFVWNGTDWVQTGDENILMTAKTMIEETDRRVSVMAEEQMAIGDQVYRNYAAILVQADRITQEVERAQLAEDMRIAKTSQYQTADEIVSEAVRQSGVAMSGMFISKTSVMQTADDIVTEAVRMAGIAGDTAYLAQTTTYQTAESIVQAAKTYTNGQLANYSTLSQTSSAISAYVASNAYQIRSGVEILNNQVRIYSGNVTSLLLNTSGFDMQTAGKFVCHAADGTASSIIFGTNEANATFAVGMSGDVRAHSLTVDQLTVNGKGYPGLIVSENMPSGSNVLWIKPTSESTRQWSKTPDNYNLNQAGGTLGWYRDYTISYSAADYLSGNLYYGIKANLVLIAQVAWQDGIKFKARLKNGDNWIELGYAEGAGSYGLTIVLDTLTSSTLSNIMNVTGGTFTVRLESNYGAGTVRLQIADFILKAKNTSGSGAAACSLFYIN